MLDRDATQHDALKNRVDAGLAVPPIRDDRRRQAWSSAYAMATLSGALRAWLQDPVALTDDGAAGSATYMALSQALRGVCAAAHADGTPVEHLVIALKGLMASLPELRAREGLLDAAGARALRGKLVTACIEAYYAPEDAAGGSRDTAGVGRPLDITPPG